MCLFFHHSLLIHFAHSHSDLNNFVARNVQYVAPQKFRCRIPDCPKVFKGDEFVRKHIFNKHADRVEAYRRRAVLFNAYLKDPFKLSYVDVLEATHRQQRRVGGGSHTVSSAPRFMAPLTEIAGEFRAAMMGLDGRRQRGGSHPAEALMGGGRDRRPSYEDNGGRPNSATGPARQQVQYVDWDAPTGVVPLATAAASVVDELDYD